MTLSLGYLAPAFRTRRNYSDAFARRDAGWLGDGFAVDGGAASITPTEGSERSFNGDLETWSSPTNAGSFTEVVGGSSSVNQESGTVHGGTYAARLDIDSSNTLVNLTQTIAGTTGEWTLARFWLRASASGKTGILASSAAGYSEAPARNPGTSWVEYAQNGRFTADGGQYQWGRDSAASASLYLDDISIKPLTLATMFATRKATVSDVQVAAEWTIAMPGTWSGVAACLDDPNDPQNFILGITNGVYAKLIQCVAGVYTELVNTTIAYVTGAGIEIWKVGSAVRLIYDGIQVGTDQTISNAEIIGNVYHGLFSGYGGNSAAHFVYQEVAMSLSLAQLLPVYPTNAGWLAHIDFATADDAPVTNPYLGEIGQVDITDSANTLAVTGGVLTPSAAATGNRDPYLREIAGRARVPGRTFQLRIKRSNTLGADSGNPVVGWTTNLTATASTMYGLLWSSSSGAIGNVADLGSFPAHFLLTLVDNTYYVLSFVLDTVGFKILLDGKLIYKGYGGSGATLYPAVFPRSANDRPPFVDYWDVRDIPALGDWALASLNVAAPVNGQVYTAQANQIVSMDITAPGSLANECGIKYRYSDGDNYLRAYFNSSGAFVLEKIAATVRTELIAPVASAITAGATRTIEVLVESKHRCWTINSGVKTGRGADITDTFNASATGVVPDIGATWAAANLRSLPVGAANYSALLAR